MADNADRATALMEMRLEGALASHLLPTAPAAVDDCEECGEPIPAARRQAAPWATTCIDCQSIREGKNKHVRQAP